MMLTLRYLGGCPGRDRPETVQVAVEEDRFELRGRGWGWRIGFGSVMSVGDAQPAPDGDGAMVPVVWQPPDTGERTLMLSGRDAGRLRFLLAQAVAARQYEAERSAERPSPPAPPPPARRPLGPWARELRRMRAVTLAALTVALVALVLVFGVAVAVLGSRFGGGHWARDRALLTQRSQDITLAQERNDVGGLSQALQALVDECHRLEAYNGEATNTGKDFDEAQRLCATVGVALF